MVLPSNAGAVLSLTRHQCSNHCKKLPREKAKTNATAIDDTPAASWSSTSQPFPTYGPLLLRIFVGLPCGETTTKILRYVKQTKHFQQVQFVCSVYWDFSLVVRCYR